MATTNMAAPIMNSLLAEGRVVRGWLGAMIQDLTPELATELRIRNHEGNALKQPNIDHWRAHLALDPDEQKKSAG